MEWPKVLVSGGRFTFLNNNTLIVSWVTPDEPLPHLPKPKKHSRLPVVPAHLKILFLDARTGNKLKEHEFPVPSAPTDLLISRSGNLIVRAGDTVDLYSPDFVPLNHAKFALPLDWESVNSASDIKISLDGRRIVLCSERGSSLKAEILDTEGFRLLDSFSGSQPDCPGELVNDLSATVSDHPQRITVKKMGEEPRVLELTAIESTAKGPMPRVQLMSADMLAVLRENQIAVVTTNGKVLFNSIVPKRHLFGSVTAARDSDRFAVEVARMRGLTIPSLDMYAFPSADQLLVYSLHEQAPILAAKLKGMSPWTPWHLVSNSAALSPDGSLAAVLTGDSVRVYKLPPSSKDKSQLQ
ncbi:MAG TPA: hypothetical protein VGT03_01315 [Candidatus Acidoferrales bacterium]|nr:hypothetical protein [Candidatus Acidoferrales bacterium]